MEEAEQYLSQKTKHFRQVWDDRIQRSTKIDHQLETMREDLKKQQGSFQQLVTRHEKHLAMSKQLTQLCSITSAGGYQQIPLARLKALAAFALGGVLDAQLQPKDLWR